jgi:sarcosine oxidase subunit beta
VPVGYTSKLPRTAELVVVGGGIIGAATAFYASRAGYRPVLLERRSALCTLTTAAAAGGFRLQLDREEELRLVRESVELFLNFAEVTGQREYDPQVRQQGYLWVTTSEDRAATQRRLVEAQRSWGLRDVEVLAGQDVRRRFPFISSHVVQGRFRAGDGLIDPKALTFGLVAGSRAWVGTGCEVLGFRVRGGRVTGVETSTGTVSTDTVVVAAGPFSGLVAAAAGVELPVTTVRRQKMVMPEVPEVPPDAPMTIDDDTGAHWRPAFRGAYLLFTDPETPPSPPEDEVPVDQGFAGRLLDPGSAVSVARVTSFWKKVWERGNAHWLLQAGQYTMTPDRRPLIGSTPVEGLYVNTGYSGRGVMGGPAGSRHLIDVMTGKVEPSDNPFRLDRSFAQRPHLDPL